jgi:hypothetical protein
MLSLQAAAVSCKSSSSGIVTAYNKQAIEQQQQRLVVMPAAWRQF